MYSLVPYMLKGGGLINLPLATFAVGYAVIEEDNGDISCVFALKTPGVQSPYEVLEAAMARYPQVPWLPSPDIAARGHTTGAASPYAFYKLILKEDGSFEPDGGTDLGTAFFDAVMADSPLLAGADQLESFLEKEVLT